MKRVTFRGTGQLNGPRSINKVLELEDQTAKDLMGQNRDRVILALMAVHFPGVEIKPKNIGINVESIYEKADSNSAKQFLKKTKPSSFSFTNIILWILFFPFKLVWWMLKEIWNTDHVTGKRL